MEKATLTDRARQTIRMAADNSTHVQYTRIVVNGYTDTSGPRVKQGLSVRRAEAVAAELARDGVARQPIFIQGFGATHLKVPTGPGVREPQNECNCSPWYDGVAACEVGTAAGREMMVDAITGDSIQALCDAEHRPQHAEPRGEG